MLSEMTSVEISEWYAYYNVKHQYEEQAKDENAEAAKIRAKKNNY